MINDEITAKLSEVRLERLPMSISLSGCDVIAIGKIYADKRGRFADGAEVQTSRVVKVTDGKIYTLNSVYEVI